MTDESEYRRRFAQIRSRFLAPLTPEAQANLRKREENLRAIAEESRIYEQNRALIEGGIPRDYWTTILSPRQTQALKVVRDFIELSGPKSNLLVLGGVGDLGKSFAAAHAVFTHGGMFVSAVELVQSGAFNDIWRTIERGRVLAIDELGQEPQDTGGWFAGCFEEAFNKRCGGSRKTIVTTNLDGKRFFERYATGNFDRLARRWKGFGRFEPIEAKWLAP